MRGKPLTYAEKLGILNDYRAGLRCADIAVARGVSLCTVSNIANKRGLRRSSRPTDWVLQSIADAYSKGEKVAFIGAEFGVHFTSVRRIARRFGVPMRPSGRQKKDRIERPRKLRGPSEEVAQAVAAAYQRGDKVAVIAAVFHLHHTTIRRIANKHGVPIRLSGGQRKVRHEVRHHRRDGRVDDPLGVRDPG